MDDLDLEVRGSYTPGQLALVRRQMRAWTDGDVEGAVPDWAEEGVLTAPRGVRVRTADLPGVIRQWAEMFGDLEIGLRSLFASEDGRWLAIEWTWTVTRRSDGARGAAVDAIIAELDEDGLIVGWREYFDTFGSVEFGFPAPEDPPR